MNFKTNARVILLPVFCIVFNSSFIFVDSALANADLRVATTCLRKFCGEIDKSYYLDNDDLLTDGEYLESFCSDTSADYLDEIISKKAGGNYDGAEIKQCLKKENRSDIFDKYARRTSSNGLLQIIQSSIYANSNIRKFIKGVCESKEFSEFGELIHEKDKEEALKCLEVCSGKFIRRVANVINGAKTETIEILKKKLLKKEKDPPIAYEGQITDLNKSKNDAPEDYSKRLYAGQNHLDIDLMTILGTEYLYNYGEIYNKLDQVLTEDDRQLDNSAGNLDRNLFSVFSFYKACAIKGCGMKPSTSIPFYKIVEHVANYPALNTLLLTKDGMEKYESIFGSFMPKYRNFFKALWTGGHDIKIFDGKSQDNIQPY